MDANTLPLLMAALLFRGTTGASLRPDLGLVPPETPRGVVDIMRRAWVAAPADRPSMTDVARELLTAVRRAPTPIPAVAPFYVPPEQGPPAASPPPSAAAVPLGGVHADIPSKTGTTVASGPSEFAPVSTGALAGSNPYAASVESRATEKLDPAMARHPIRVFIKAFGRESLNPIPATLGTTILEVKRGVEKASRGQVLAPYIRLIHIDQASATIIDCQDARTLFSYGIGDGTVLHLMTPGGEHGHMHNQDLVVKRMDGSVMNILIPPTLTIGHIKNMVSLFTHQPAEEQMMVFAGRVLADHLTPNTSPQPILKGSVLHLMRKTAGASSAPAAGTAASAAAGSAAPSHPAPGEPGPVMRSPHRGGAPGHAGGSFGAPPMGSFGRPPAAGAGKAGR